MAVTRSSRLVVGNCATCALPAKATMPTFTCARQFLDEALGRLLRGHQPVGLHVGRAHAARHVHRQDDGLLVRRQHHHGHRPRGGDQHRGQRQQEQEGRDVAAHALARRPSPRARSTGWRSAAPASSCAAAARRTAAPAAAAPAAARGIGARGNVMAPLRPPCAGVRHGRRRAAAALAHVGEAHDGLDQVVVGREFERVDADLGQRLRAGRPRVRAAMRAKRLRKPASCVSTQQLLAGLGVAQRHQAEVGQFEFERIEQAHRDHVMALRQLRQRLLPAGLADEVGHHEHGRAARHQHRRRTSAGRPAGSCPSGRARPRPRGAPSRAAGAARGAGRCAAGSRLRRRCRRPCAPTRLPWRVSRRASTPTKPAEISRLALVAGAEVDRAAQVQHEPGRHLAVFGEHAHVRRLQPRGDVPVDVAHVVVVLVFAQVGQVQAGAAHQRAVVALQQAVEPADHRPFEPAQRALDAARRGFGRRERLVVAPPSRV